MLSDNQRSIMDIVRRSPSITRALITERTDLTQQSVHRIIDQLIEAGLIALSDGPRAGPGKPSPLISLNGAASYSLGLLANTDSVVLSIKDLTCATVFETRAPMDMSDHAAALRAISDLFDTTIQNAGLDRTRFCGMGFSMPGYFVSAE